MIPKKFIDMTLNKYYTAHNTPFQIKRFGDGNNASPNIYGERVNKGYGEPIECLGYIETEPTELRMEELGWHKDIPELVITIPVSTLQDHELLVEDGETLPFKVNITLDDLLVVPSLGITYKVSKIGFVRPYINNKPTFVCLGGRKYTSAG